MKSERPLLVTESVTMVVPGYFLQQQTQPQAYKSTESLVVLCTLLFCS